ncbi:MAG: YhfC family glutamic-type intramembrane protease [bacterium]
MLSVLLGEYIFVFLFLLNLPIFLGVFFGRRWRIPARFWFFGLLVFFLIQIMHFPAVIYVKSHSPLPHTVLALVLGILAGIYEEAGRWISFRWLFPSITSRTQAFMFGLGWAGMEIFFIALSLGANFVFLFLLDVNSLIMAAEIPEETRKQLVESILALRENIQNAPGYAPFLPALERISALFWHILFTFLVFSAVREGKWWRWWYAFTLHFIIDFLMVLLIPWMNAGKNLPLYPRVLLFELIFLLLSTLALWQVRKYLLSPTEPHLLIS